MIEFGIPGTEADRSNDARASVVAIARATVVGCQAGPATGDDSILLLFRILWNYGGDFGI